MYSGTGGAAARRAASRRGGGGGHGGSGKRGAAATASGGSGGGAAARRSHARDRGGASGGNGASSSSSSSSVPGSGGVQPSAQDDATSAESLRLVAGNRIIDELKGIATSSGFKVLVLDDVAVRFISHVCQMKDLISRGRVSNVERLGLPRQPLPTMDAVYLMEPTPEAIEQLIADYPDHHEEEKKTTFGNFFKRKKMGDTERESFQLVPCMYSTAYIYFLSRPTPNMLERIKATAQLVPRIRRMTVLNLSFTCLEGFVWMHERRNALLDYVGPQPTLRSRHVTAAKEAYGLLTVFGVMQRRPIIRYSHSASDLINSLRGEYPRLVAFELEKQLDELARTSSVFPSVDAANRDVDAVGHAQRPLVLIVDRTDDVMSALMHDTTYSGVAREIFNFEEQCKFKSLEGQDYDVLLNENEDIVWQACRYKYVQHAAATVKQELDGFRTKNAVAKYQGRAADELTGTQMVAITEDMASFSVLAKTISQNVDMIARLQQEMGDRNLFDLMNVEATVAIGVDGREEPASEKFVMGLVEAQLAGARRTAEEKLRLVILLAIKQGGLTKSQRERILACWPELLSVHGDAFLNLAHVGIPVECKKKVKKLEPLARRDAMLQGENAPIHRYRSWLWSVLQRLMDDQLDLESFPLVNPGERALWSTLARAHGAVGSISRFSARSEGGAGLGIGGGGASASGTSGAGPPVIVYVVGGFVNHEMRDVYELRQRTGRGVYLGGSTFLSAGHFLALLDRLNK